MNQSNNSPSFVVTRLATYTPLAEKLLLGVFLAGVILLAAGIDHRIAAWSLVGLAVSFFLMGYLPQDIPVEKDFAQGFRELLALSVIPKVLWIASAISAMGVAFYLMEMPDDRYRRMVMIGGTTIASGTILLVFFMATGVRHVRLVSGVLFRAVPLFALDLYLFLK